jgi:hypothetical protein
MTGPLIYPANGRSATLISGAGILHRHLTALQRGAYAAMERLGELTVIPSRRQAVEHWHSNTAYVAVLEKLSPETRRRIAKKQFCPSFEDLSQATATATVRSQIRHRGGFETNTEATGLTEELLKGLEGLAPPQEEIEAEISDAALIELGSKRLIRAFAAALAVESDEQNGIAGDPRQSGHHPHAETNGANGHAAA